MDTDMSVDLLKTKITGCLSVTIIDPHWTRSGWVLMGKAIKASLFAYVHDAYITINGTISPRESNSDNWEVIKVRPEKKNIKGWNKIREIKDLERR